MWLKVISEWFMRLARDDLHENGSSKAKVGVDPPKAGHQPLA